jgi:hypothetical protein
MRVADKSKVHGVGGTVLKDAIPSRDRLWVFYPRLLQLNLLLTGALACNFTNGYVNLPNDQMVFFCSVGRGRTRRPSKQSHFGGD